MIKKLGLYWLPCIIITAKISRLNNSIRPNMLLFYLMIVTNSSILYHLERFGMRHLSTEYICSLKLTIKLACVIALYLVSEYEVMMDKTLL